MLNRKKWMLFILIGILISLIMIWFNQTKAINVKDYGAIGDGVTDDTEAIQRALQDSRAHKIYFPTGEYKITKEIRISDKTEIDGNHAILKAASDLFSMLHIKGGHVRIQGLTINGNERSLRGITIANGSSDVVISECTIENLTQPKDPSLSRLTVSGIRIEGGTRNITIDHSKIHNIFAKNPIKGWGHHVARGILISPEHKQQPVSKNITISNSTITNIGPKDDGDGIVIQGFTEAVNLQILNNTFSYNHKRAIKIQSPGALIKGNKIYNNFYKNNFYHTYPEKEAYDMWAAISVYANHTTIEQNTITGVGNFARIIDVSNASNIKIINNMLENGYKGSDEHPSIISITSTQPGYILKNFTIIDNTFINGEFGVLAASKITNLNVWNNKLQ
ncbi:glycosyl hydrolase family 28-related protein [Bacillus sp. FJAT-29814]|uniref:glycosyl hydrolase family 28-related protein n=1 Tax=Bacillus sp. FJAT-29814 TaxID=1729688 RepID=UPI000833173F|nr:glycosyl hydrolase family 28-related protein [Bacillus sp. FJAT-29814]